MVPSLSEMTHIGLWTHPQLRKILASRLCAPQLTGRCSTPFPLNTDGVLADGSIINYLPDPPNVIYHSCWTAPKSRPPPNQRYIYGKCSVCMVQRNGTDGSADYQLWARDMDNNAMGNMYATTVSPIDDKKPDHPVNASMIMGRWPLLLQAKKNEKNLAKVKLLWTTPPLDPHNPAIWSDRRAQFTTFIPGNSDAGFTGCADAGSALNGAVRYAQCAFDCWEDMRP